MTKPKVLVTGASGLIGGLVLGNLADRYEFSGLSRHAVPGIPYTEAPITDLEAVRRAVAGQDMVVHLAGETKNDDNWDDHFQVTAGGTINVLRASAEAGTVRRVVVMSTGSTMCGWEWDDSLPYGRLAAGERDLPPGSCSTTGRRRVPTARTAPPSCSARRPRAGSPTRRR